MAAPTAAAAQEAAVRSTDTTATESPGFTAEELAAAEAGHYSMLIQWSEEDQLYLVGLPEWGDTVHTHGATYMEAAQMGTEALALLIAAAKGSGKPLPAPRLFAGLA